MRGPQPWKTNRARVLRDRQVTAEARMWAKLRNRQLVGHKFVRQAPIGPYFVDFLCRVEMVVVEVDGATHGTEEEIAADKLREAALKELGYRIFRATNGAVFNHLDSVLDALVALIENSED